MKKKYLKHYLFFLMPFLWALMWICLSFSPVRLWQNYHQTLPLVLIVIFYYALFDYRRFNIFIVFILGLLADFLSFGSVGLNCFIYALIFFMANLLQPYIQNFSFRYLWLFFCALMLITDIIWAWLGRLTTGIWVSASFWFVQYLFTCLCYPMITWITAKLNCYTKDV